MCEQYRRRSQEGPFTSLVQVVRNMLWSVRKEDGRDRCLQKWRKPICVLGWPHVYL